MAITEKQRQDRQKYLGSSDLPAIMGFSRWASAYDVWMYKTGRVQKDPRERDYLTAGQMFEDGVLRWMVEKQGVGSIKRNQERIIEGLPIKVHMDAIVVDTGNPVEAKTAGLFGPLIENWGEPCTDEVPEDVCIQGHCHLMATDREICHVPTFLGGRGYGYYFIKRDEKIVELIKEEAIAFWDENVLKNVPPPDSVPTLTLIKRIRRIDSEPVEIEEDLIERWLSAKEIAKSAEKSKKEAEAAIRAALDGREIGLCRAGQITDFEQHRKAEKEVRGPTSFRVLRLKKK